MGGGRCSRSLDDEFDTPGIQKYISVLLLEASLCLLPVGVVPVTGSDMVCRR